MCKDDTLSSGTAFLYPFCVCIHLCQRNDLNLVCFGVPENNLAVRQEHIPNQNVPDSRSATSAVQQEVNNHPVAVFAEIAIRRRLFQQTQQRLIRIRLFDRLDLFVIWNIECRIWINGLWGFYQPQERPNNSCPPFANFNTAASLRSADVFSL